MCEFAHGSNKLLLQRSNQLHWNVDVLRRRSLAFASKEERTIERPSYLLRISPELYQQVQWRVAERFSQAVELAEQAFVAEFAKLVQHLTERVQDDASGERRLFCDSAVANLHAFFDRFRKLSVRSSADLDRLIDQAQELVRGVTPAALRSDEALRRQIAQEMG